ncbi:MAG TPA: hypothetical protein VJ724_07935 [Tahibacter sp.]|nr:hypothetical protein [Tahibacter sp.]
MKAVIFATFLAALLAVSAYVHRQQYRAGTLAPNSGVSSASSVAVDGSVPVSTRPARTTPALPRNRTVASSAYPRAYDFTPTPFPETGAVLPLYREYKSRFDAGEPNAGYLLFEAMWRCMVLPNRAVGHDGATAESIETDLRDCDGVGAAEIAGAWRLLESAAERGDVEAQLLYGEVGSQRYGARDLFQHPEYPLQFRKNYLRFVEAAISSGSSRAIAELANEYRAGQFVDADPFKAYAYEYALILLKPDWHRGNLDWSARSLTPEQIASAQRLAAQILKRCCE